MLRSLKLRIALLTAVITTSVGIIGAIFTLQNISRSQIEKIDEEIKLLAVTNIPKLLDLRPPRERLRSRAQPTLQELPSDFWITISQDQTTTVYHSPNTPSFWLEQFPEDPETHGNPFFLEQNRFPLNRTFVSPRSNPRETTGPRALLPERIISNISFDTIQINEKKLRVGNILSERGYELNFIKDLETSILELREIRRSVFRAIPLVILLTIVASAFLSSRALSPFRKISNEIDEVSEAGLNARLTANNAPSEFIPLVTSINDMLERIDRNFHQANRFAADASHELRTPLTILQGHLEKLIQAEPDSSDKRLDEYANLLEEVNRLQRLSSQLLFLARSDSGHFKIKRQKIDAYTELSELINDYRELYPNHEFTYCAPKPLEISADWPLLQQAIANLLTNAVSYGDDQKRVYLRITQNNTHTCIHVKNTGPAIPQDTAAHLFDRFYRASEARGRTPASTGTGLGLSLAQESVKAHGGKIAYAGHSEGMNRFEITLPQSY